MPLYSEDETTLVLLSTSASVVADNFGAGATPSVGVVCEERNVDDTLIVKEILLA